jgi:hypothetical protein
MKIGDTILITKNTNSHNYKIGFSYIIKNISTNNNVSAGNDNWVGNSLPVNNFIILEKKDIMSNISKTKLVIEKMDKILKFFKETGNKIYNKEDYNKWRLNNLNDLTVDELIDELIDDNSININIIKQTL